MKIRKITPKFSTSSRAGNGDWRLGPVNHVMFLPFLPPQGDDSSHYSSVSSSWRHSSMGFSSRIPCHGLHISTNCHSVSPSLGCWTSGTDCPLCVPCRVTSPASKSTPVQAAYMGQSLFLASPCSGMGSSMGCRGTACLTWVCRMQGDLCSKTWSISYLDELVKENRGEF